MSETPSVVDLANLDRLYWHTDLPVATVAARVGLPARSLHTHATPLPAGVACYRCGDPLQFTSRSQRDGQRLRCGECGCSRRSPNERGARRRSPPPLGLVGQSLILVRDGHHDLGWVIERCLDALAEAAAPWDGHSLVVLPADDVRPAAVLDALRRHDAGVVAVESLCDLAGTQTKRLQVLFELTHTGWRVIAAKDYRVERALTARHLDDFECLDDWSEPLIDATASFGRLRFLR
jgi:hypothetical protein